MLELRNKRKGERSKGPKIKVDWVVSSYLKDLKIKVNQVVAAISY
jgi:hypothetical protein